MELKIPIISVRTFIDNYIAYPGNVNRYYQLLLDEGYIPVEVNQFPGSELQKWAMENIGWENYNWTGNVFWFNNEQDATIFRLKWA